MLNKKIVKVGVKDQELVRDVANRQLVVTFIYSVLIYDKVTKNIEEVQDFRTISIKGAHWRDIDSDPYLPQLITDIHKDNKISIKAQYEE